ncbi:MAG TPA: PSD1 and planctomycete cytochrome C domain-containing protein [Tepidisphaeraceae bacterium]|jgi:hypothetical protein|nr:PSD1 and planctomycete cytochrome C domain-containing protein [Tepidisphaeraceae bacterium]
MIKDVQYFRVRFKRGFLTAASPRVLPAAFVVISLLSPGFTARAADAMKPEDVQFFEKQVRPLLEARCLKCHGAESKIKGGLRLTTRDAVLKGGEQGVVVSVDHPEKSLLLAAIGYDGELKMPPKAKLAPEEAQVLTQWVKSGAAWTPGLDLTPAGVVVAEPVRTGPPTVEEAKSFWSFKPVQRPQVPAVHNAQWVRNPIDAFVLAKLEAKGMTPAPPADKVALLRRAYYDLTGLPPSPAEVDAFIADQSADAYEKVVDKLLASPHYGEKWGRHWLDLIRYGESNSYERDNPKPNVWRFRDYVIRSFNDDKPYDRFVKEQLAGDEMPEAAENADPVIATGFYRLGIFDDEPNDRLQARYDNLDDIVTTTGQVFLGLTVDCARCHNHKIDPIPQADYYRLLAFFQNINSFNNGGPGDEVPILPAAGREAFELRQKERKDRQRQAYDAAEEMKKDFRQLISGEPGREKVSDAALPDLIRKEGKRVLGAERYAQYEKLRREVDSLGWDAGKTDMALCVTERGAQSPDTFICLRGNANVPGDKVVPGFLQVLGGGDAVIPEPPKGAKTTGRRTVLANWVASTQNPLFARVMANRIFQYHFGRGIVRSPNNFGTQGDKPTHPELLDWLASQFVEGGWRMKPMHRLIMTSNAYRMSSRGDPAALAADPQNELFWRFDMRRLTAEEIRDSILALDGTLNLKMYGPSVFPHIPKEVMAGQSIPGRGWDESTADEAVRRSVYVHVKRSLQVPILQSFDTAETDRSCPVRFVTVQPTQALGMLNGSFIHGEARKLAARLKKEAGDDRAKQVALAWRLATSREATRQEVDRSMALIGSLENQDGATPDQAMDYFCLMVMNLNEFVYLD